MTHHALINVKPPKLPPHTVAFPQPVPGSVLCQLEVLSVSQVWLVGAHATRPLQRSDGRWNKAGSASLRPWELVSSGQRVSLAQGALCLLFDAQRIAQAAWLPVPAILSCHFSRQSDQLQTMLDVHRASLTHGWLA